MGIKTHEFVKVENDNLYTAITSYKKYSTTITSIAVKHLGMKDYYKKIQKEIDKHDIGLYECIKPMQKGVKLPVKKSKYADLSDIVKNNFKKMAGYMGEDYCMQKDVIKYGPAWENTDMSEDELLIKLPYEILEEFYKGIKADTTRFDNIYKNHPENISRMVKIDIMAPFDPSNRIIENLREAFFGVDEKKGQFEEVVVVERNKIVYDALDRKIDEGCKDIAVIYGSLHMEDLENFIDGKGFKKKKKKWLCAIKS